MVSDVDVKGDNKFVKIILPEILHEEKRDLVLDLCLSKQTQALPRKMNIADITVSYSLATDDGKLETKSINTKAKVLFVKSGKEQQKPHQEYDKIVALAQIVKAQIEAESNAAKGDFVKAQQICVKLCQDLTMRGLEGHANMITKIGNKMEDSNSYLNNSSYLNASRNYVSRGVCCYSAHDDLRVDISKSFNLESTGTSVQKRLEKEFTSDKDIVEPESPLINVVNASDNSSSSIKFNKSRKYTW